MLDLPTQQSIEEAIALETRPKLRALLSDRLADTLKCGLEELTHILVVEPGDGEEAIVEAIGFSPLTSRIAGIRNQPDWDWLERHDGWWELLYTIGNDGFAYILIVEDADESPLAALCRDGEARS